LGIEGLDQAEGMWAFAYYNKVTSEFFLCRDRFGEKPLYYYEDGNGIYFGSEIKYIFALLGEKLKINYNHICRYLVNGYKSLYKTDEKFFVGLKEIPPNRIMKVKSGKVSIVRYWNEKYEFDGKMKYDEAVSLVRDQLIRAVELRLRSDVPIAFCMSGGIDSNSIICIAKKILGYDVHGFTVIEKDSRYDEEIFVRKVVDELSLKHTVVIPERTNFLNNLRSMIIHRDGPVYVVNFYAHWVLINEMKKNGYKISISGTGADELFSGYYDHHLFYFLGIKDNEELFYKSIENWREKVLPFVRNPFLKDPYRFVNTPFFRDHIYLHSDYFCSFLTKPFYESFKEEKYTMCSLRNRMLNELFHETVPVMLRDDDNNAMGFSLENRSPFLDRKLFELCYKIPTEYLIQNGLAKSVLRDAIRGIVPDAILDNPRKVGFNFPINSYLDIENSLVHSYLLEN